MEFASKPKAILLASIRLAEVLFALAKSLSDSPLSFLLTKNESLTLFEPCYARLQRDVPDRTQWVKQGGLRSGSRRRTQPKLDKGVAMR